MEHEQELPSRLLLMLLEGAPSSARYDEDALFT
ncbi:hypothetical protein F783_016530 [Bordetella holmesii F627]|nr:hypothetical protein F783_016530 [Bordetella holmesii F627]